jgi:peroxiredoxin
MWYLYSPLFASLLLFQTAALAAASVGESAPTFTLTDTHGETHSLGDFRGKVVVLEWTNHECPFVQKHYGADNMQTLQRTYTDQDVIWLSIISSAPGEQGYVEPAEANSLTASRKASPTAVLMDPTGDVGRAYGAKTTPHMYIIDGDGTLVYMGGIDSIRSTRMADIEKATPYVKVSLNEVLAAEPVSNPVTRPYGCTIKY